MHKLPPYLYDSIIPFVHVRGMDKTVYVKVKAGLMMSHSVFFTCQEWDSHT